MLRKYCSDSFPHLKATLELLLRHLYLNVCDQGDHLLSFRIFHKEADKRGLRNLLYLQPTV